MLTQKELSIDAVRADMMQRTEEIEAAERKLAELEAATIEREAAAATLAADAADKLATIAASEAELARSVDELAARPGRAARGLRSRWRSARR